MKRKLTFEEQQQAAAGQKTQSQATQEFANVEEMLRHYAIHTPVPPEIEMRLQKSTATLPAPKRSWLRKLFGG